VLGVDFRVVASGEAEESDEGLPAAERVMAHARGKAREVAGRTGIPDRGAVLGADTEVVLDDRAMGKAADRRAAAGMLQALSGRVHQVMTGVVLITPRGETEALSVAEVHMRPLDAPTVEWYLEQGEWQGRAGAYAIQGAGAVLVEGITGDPSAVIGLPVPTVADLLRAEGLFP
jgi:septum formation protein